MNSFDDDSELGVLGQKMPDWQEVHDFALRLARNNSKNREDAEDIAQGIIKKLFIKDLQIRAWRSYVKTMVLNACADLYRRDERERRHPGEFPEPGSYKWRTAMDLFNRPISMQKPRDLSIEVAENELVLEILAEVPEGHRELFIDHLEGVPSAELARFYGYASAASVNQTLSRIKSALRRKFKGANLES